MLSNVRPVTSAPSNFLAPVSPVSSSTVNSSSSGPCASSGSSAAAIEDATPSPLSAPSVVVCPALPTQSPRRSQRIGSRDQSCAWPSAAPATMSTWLCSTTVGADSSPGEAGTRTTRLPAASAAHDQPRPSKPSRRAAITRASPPEGRGISHSQKNASQNSRGRRACDRFGTNGEVMAGLPGGCFLGGGGPPRGPPPPPSNPPRCPPRAPRPLRPAPPPPPPPPPPCPPPR